MSKKLEKNYESLIQNFLNLLESAPYEKISVEQVASTSQMTRVNFYHYFTDKEDLLWKSFQYVYLEGQKKVTSLDPVTLLSDGKPLTFYAFENIKENVHFYKRLFVDGMPYHFLVKVIDYITSESFRTHQVIREQYNDPKIPYQVVNQFLSGAFINVVRNLLLSEKDWDPLEYSEFFRKLAISGLQGSLAT